MRQHARIALLLTVAVTLVGCGTPSSRSLPSISGSSRRPVDNLSKYEFPFDADGNYVESWAAAGEKRFGRSASASSSRSSASSSSRSSSSRSSSKPKPSTRYHTVRRGDTLYGLSRKYGRSVSSIKSANGLRSDLIRDGQRLKIP